MTQITSEQPFGHHGRMTDPAALFDRKYELGLLHIYLTKGMCCQIVGPHGIGKSSLLYNVRTFAPDWDPAFLVAYLDLQDPHCHTVGGFWERTAAAWADSSVPASPADMAERIEEWRKRGRRPVLCLDDFEALASRPREFTSDFFFDLRAIAQQGMSVVTASQQPLSAVLSVSNPVSPFFNIFAILRLGPFTKEDAVGFVALHRPGVPPFAPEEQTAILALAKGHPLALQLACFRVLHAKKDGESLETAMQRAAADIQAQLPAGW
jgi:hypothetical protein